MHVSEFGQRRFLKFLDRIEAETYPEFPSDLHTKISQQRLDHFLELTQLPPQSKILDVGCGQGPALDYLKTKNYHPIGITLNETDVLVCRSKGHEVYQMEQSFLDFKESSLDAVWARHCIEHSLFPYFTLSEFSRTLKIGGYLYLEMPNAKTMFQHETNKNHYSVLTDVMWVELLKRTGFEVVEALDMSIPLDAGTDHYLTFIAKKTEERPGPKLFDKTIHLGLPSGSNYGWGLCGSYLRKELGTRAKVSDPGLWHPVRWREKLPGTLLVALDGDSLEKWIPLTADQTIGYVFFENLLTAKSRQNAESLDLVLAGSTWCKERMLEQGIRNVDVLLQGIDPELYHPITEERESDEFVLFSGGKFELRKGQDLVLAAFKILQEKLPNLKLLNVWENQWPESMRTMALSSRIKFADEGATWVEKMQTIYVLNGIDPKRVQTCPLLPNRKMRSIFARTDLGVFPNRCEGGTNLVLMEYMACGKPVIASNVTGHRDIVNEKNAFLIHQTSPLEVKNSQGQPMAQWEDPSLDELVARIEEAYHQKEVRSAKAKQAAEDLKKLTWAAMADRVMMFLK